MYYLSCFLLLADYYEIKYELLENFMAEINKTASIVHFNITETDGEIIFNNYNKIIF